MRGTRVVGVVVPFCVRVMERRLGKTCSRHRSTRGAGSLFRGACHRDTHKRVIGPEIHAAECGGATRATVLFFARRVARAPRGARADGVAPRFSRLAKTAETKGGRTRRVSWRERGNESGRTLRAGKRRSRRSRAAEEAATSETTRGISKAELRAVSGTRRHSSWPPRVDAQSTCFGFACSLKR